MRTTTAPQDGHDVGAGSFGDGQEARHGCLEIEEEAGEELVGVQSPRLALLAQRRACVQGDDTTKRTGFATRTPLIDAWDNSWSFLGG